jgi:hypothetical protein
MAAMLDAKADIHYANAMGPDVLRNEDLMFPAPGRLCARPWCGCIFQSAPAIVIAGRVSKALGARTFGGDNRT